MDLEKLGLQKIRKDVFLHAPSGVLMHFVPGGEVRMGLSDGDLAKLREQYQFRDDCDEVDHFLAFDQIRPCVTVRVKPFLMAARPLSGEQLQALLSGSPPTAKGRKLPDMKKVAKLPAQKYLEHLRKFDSGTFDEPEIAGIEAALAKVGLRLPSEAEWECAARGGTDRLFANGDTIPSTPNVGANPFGFVDMGADGDVCADGWVPTLEGIPLDGSPRPPSAERAARGGAAACYPWQGCAEWTLLLCAWRASSRTHEGFLTARPVLVP